MNYGVNKVAKRTLKCQFCGVKMICENPKLYRIFAEAWGYEHKNCGDIQYIYSVKIKKGVNVIYE